MGPSLIINPAGRTREVQPERTGVPIYTVLCFSRNRNANFNTGGENWSKSLAALGKKLSKNSEIVQKTRSKMSTPGSMGWPPCKILSRASIDRRLRGGNRG